MDLRQNGICDDLRPPATTPARMGKALNLTPVTSCYTPLYEACKIKNRWPTEYIYGIGGISATVHSNCSEQLWLYARTILVAPENYSGRPENRIEAIQNLPDVRFLFLLLLLTPPPKREYNAYFKRHKLCRLITKINTRFQPDALGWCT